MLAGPPCAAGSRSSDPPLVVYRFGNPRVLDVRSLARPNKHAPEESVSPQGHTLTKVQPVKAQPARVQIIRRTGGNAGNAIRGFATVRAYAYVETDTSLTLSLYARARAWEDGVGEGHFVGARSRSEDREVRRSRASRT
jgi:hypothetical protein